MQYQEYISLLEAFRLSLTAENDPNVVQIVDQINETVANLKTGNITLSL
jgi:CRISPR/Cas system-associated exonuclease Cas4 (RecB family)